MIDEKKPRSYVLFGDSFFSEKKNCMMAESVKRLIESEDYKLFHLFESGIIENDCVSKWFVDKHEKFDEDAAKFYWGFHAIRELIFKRHALVQDYELFKSKTKVEKTETEQK